MSEQSKPQQQARLVQGSTMRHVIEMTFAGSVGLFAIFAVDFLSLFYISRLGDERLTAGVGYATTVLFFAISVSIGLMIAAAALTGRFIGAGDREKARRVATAGVIFCAIAGIGTTFAMLLALQPLLSAIGAEGEPLRVATHFLWIVLPSNVLMAVGMCMSGILRALGDARRSMYVTLLGGIATAFLDPLFIFVLNLGTDGAAYATVISRTVFCLVGWHGVVRVHKMLGRPSLADLAAFAPGLLQIAVPAVLTNVASPVANAALLRIVRQFGHEAVTASTIIDRVVPLAFGVIFALSGSVGPILAQNFGARRFDRVRQTMRDSLLFAMIYCLVIWAVLAIGRNTVPTLFGASEKTAAFVAWFCTIGALAWVFNGLLFVSNAAFNNLGYPLYSMLFNWGRALLGTIPFAVLGARWGYEGVLVGLVIGWAIFGISSVFVAFRAIARIERNANVGDGKGLASN